MPRGRKKVTLSPSKSELLIPTYNALNELGGTASNKDICNKVISDLALPDEAVDEMHTNSNSQTELEYKLAWCRTYLKKYGVIRDIKRGIWSIQPEYVGGLSEDPKKIIAVAKGLISIDDHKPTPEESLDDDGDVKDDAQIPEENQPWRQHLLNVLLNMDPFAFERLAKRILYVSGFTEVSVTKKTGDGGIDGTGRFPVNDFFSFNIAFQCKRYAGQVSASNIQAFRGALPKNIEKGVIITTGRFTQPAIREASDSAKMQIDLIDGDKLIDLLANNNIGVTPKTIYEVDENYFNML